MRAARPDTSSTARVQRAFLRSLEGLASSDAGELRFRRPPRGSVADRWHVYAHGYAARLTEALSLEYAAVARIVGPEAFAALVTRYVAVFPPRSFDLSRAGDRLARFLEFDSETLELPFLPDLARLEEAASACFTAADAKPIAWSMLRALEPEAISGMVFSLTPGAAVIASAWPVVDLWNLRFEADDATVSVPVEGRPQTALVWRHEERVRVIAISPDEASLVEAARVGALTLEDLAGLPGAPDEVDGLAAMLAAFRSLVERGVFVNQRGAGWTGALEILKEDS
jgi:hypothetical protein